jgi:FkbM family methyltransferase
MRQIAKAIIQHSLQPFGLRVVRSSWGPRGFANSVRRAKSHGFAPATIIDVGASDGSWTTECMKVFPDARYALFEPLPENGEALRKLSETHPNVSMWTGGILGAAAGQVTLNVHGHQTSVLQSQDFPGVPVQTEMRALDDFIDSMSIIDPVLMKADVQGYELEVLRGAPRCLDMVEMLLLEVSFRQVYANCPLAHEVIAEVTSKGFRIYDFCGYLQRPRDAELTQADIVFARSSSKVFQTEGWWSQPELADVAANRN